MGSNEVNGVNGVRHDIGQENRGHGFPLLPFPQPTPAPIRRFYVKQDTTGSAVTAPVEHGRPQNVV